MNTYIDHTVLKQTTTDADIKKLCKEAVDNKFVAVCVPPSQVSHTKACLKGSKVHVATVIGFPNGYSSTKTKVFETADAVVNGADEIDMVINVGWLKDKKYNELLKEIKDIKQACGKAHLKVIVETCFLEDAEIAKIAKIVQKADADYIKTSTGFGSRGASLEDIKIFQKNGPELKIKASGGIRDFETAEKYVVMGVNRLGTSSGIAIVEGERAKKDAE